MIVKITTLGDVNVRTGAGMEFNSVHSVKGGTTLSSSEQRVDAIGNMWYKVQQGWICGKYVTLDKNLQKPDLNKRMRKLQRQILQRFDDDYYNDDTDIELIDTNTGDDNDTDDVGTDQGNVGTGDDDGPTYDGPVMDSGDPEDENDSRTIEIDQESENAKREAQELRRQNSGYNEAGDFTGIEINGGTLIPGITTGDDSDNPVEAKDIHLSRRIFGVPYQFLDTTDMRVKEIKGSSDPELGLAYTEMMNEAPILCVLPGRPMFLPDLSDDEKRGFINMLSDKVNDMRDKIIGSAASIMKDENMDTRFFSFATDYGEFIRYFNTLCQMCAVMMGLGSDMMPPAVSKFYQFRNYNWAGYTLSNILAGRITKGEEWKNEDITSQPGSIMDSMNSTIGGIVDSLPVLGSGNTQKMLDIAKKFDASGMYTDFYINPAISYSENFNNSVSASAIAGMFESASEMAKDIGFLLNTGAVDQDLVDRSNKSATQALDSTIKKHLEGNNGVLGRLIKGTTTVLAGANLIFPDIWKNSTYSKSYSIEIPLSTPYGSRRNIYLDILVPMLFWVTLTAPRQYSVNSYGSPFLVRCHVPGIFSVDSGIVESLTITKGGDGSAWSVDGFPLQMNLSITIRDLYSEIPISKIDSATDAYNFLWNTALIDYIGVQSNMDMKTSELMKKLDVATSLGKNVPYEKARNIRLRAQEAWVNSQTLAMGAKSITGKIARI